MQEVLGAYTSLSDTNELKMAPVRDQKGFRGFRDTGPSQDRSRQPFYTPLLNQPR